MSYKLFKFQRPAVTAAFVLGAALGAGCTDSREIPNPSTPEMSAPGAEDSASSTGQAGVPGQVGVEDTMAPMSPNAAADLQAGEEETGATAAGSSISGTSGGSTGEAEVAPTATPEAK